MLKQFLENTSPKNREIKNVYSIIHRAGPLTIAELMEKTRIKKTTLVRMVDELLRNKFIKENGFKESGVGRPPILYDIEKDCKYIIGIHISRMKTNIVLMNLRFQIVEQETFIMTTMHTPEFVVMRIQATIEQFMGKHQLSFESILGIGLATIGPLDRKKGKVLEPETFLAANWVNVPIVDMLQEQFPTYVLLEKGANAAVIAEYHYSNYVYDNILYCISGGWGMDCGIIQNGSVFLEQKANDYGYGHMIIDQAGSMCTCGKRGCIVAHTSFRSVLNELRNKSKTMRGMSDDIFRQATLNDMMEYFKQGDDLTNEVILQTARYLGVGLSNLVNLFQPDLVILNGPFIYETPGYYEQVVNQIEENNHGTEVKFSQGHLKENAPVVGAGILLFQSFFNDR